MPATEESGSGRPKFIADCHLGKLAKYLRLMGFDTLYFSRMEDSDLVAIALEQDRTILTRDKALSQRKNVPVFFLQPVDTRGQLQALISRYRLDRHPAPFSRCIVCNTPLEVIEKAKVLHRVPEKVGRTFSRFEYCRVCDRVYWHGDHYHRMKEFLESILRFR